MGLEECVSLMGLVNEMKLALDDAWWKALLAQTQVRCSFFCLVKCLACADAGAVLFFCLVEGLACAVAGVVLLFSCGFST
jgi:hypothetical protein